GAAEDLIPGHAARREQAPVFGRQDLRAHRVGNAAAISEWGRGWSGGQWVIHGDGSSLFRRYVIGGEVVGGGVVTNRPWGSGLSVQREREAGCVSAASIQRERPASAPQGGAIDGHSVLVSANRPGAPKRDHPSKCSEEGRGFVAAPVRRVSAGRRPEAWPGI